MPRPQTKSELLAASEQGHARLFDMLQSLTPEQLRSEFRFEHRDKNVRDVLAHLHEWQVMMLSWYETGMAGSKPEMPAKGYTWKTTPELNAVIWKKYQRTTLAQVQKKLSRSHKKLLDVVAAHTEEELFTKRRYAWTGTTSLGSYLTSATSSHYAWAWKLLRRFERTSL